MPFTSEKDKPDKRQNKKESIKKLVDDSVFGLLILQVCARL